MQQEGREVSGAGGAGVGHVLDVLAEVPVAVPRCVGIHKAARDLAPIWLGDGAGVATGAGMGAILSARLAPFIRVTS